MSNKTFIILFISIFFSTFLNHKIYGNSNTTISNFERLHAINHSIAKHKYARGMAKYMYDRIKYYQEFENWWESEYAVFKIYEALQNMDLDKE